MPGHASPGLDPQPAVMMGGDNAFALKGPVPGQPGYDAAQKDGLPGQAGQEPSREL